MLQRDTEKCWLYHNLPPTPTPNAIHLMPNCIIYVLLNVSSYGVTWGLHIEFFFFLVIPVRVIRRWGLGVLYGGEAEVEPSRVWSAPLRKRKERKVAQQLRLAGGGEWRKKMGKGGLGECLCSDDHFNANVCRLFFKSYPFFFPRA